MQGSEDEDAIIEACQNKQEDMTVAVLRALSSGASEVGNDKLARVNDRAIDEIEQPGRAQGNPSGS